LPDVSDFDDAKLRLQNIQGIFYKHHTSSIRGALAPKWTTRYYELHSGVLRYRRRAGGKYCGDISLDGARVVAESPKVSRLGECFIFRIIVSRDAAVTLSSPDKDLVTEWVHAIAGACAFYRARRCIAAGGLFANGNSDGLGQRDGSEPPSTSPSVKTGSFSEGSNPATAQQPSSPAAACSPAAQQLPSSPAAQRQVQAAQQLPASSAGPGDPRNVMVAVSSSEGGQQQRQVQAAQQLLASFASPVDPRNVAVAVSSSKGSQQQRQVQAAQQLSASSSSPVDPWNVVVAVTEAWRRASPWRRIGLSVISALLVLLLVRRTRRVRR